MRLKHHLLRWLLILACVSMTAGHVTTVYAQESSSDSSSSSDSGSSSSTDGSVGETFENADHSNSVNAGAPSAPGSSGVSDGAGSAASTAAPSYNGYSYSPSPSYGGSMPSMGDGAFSHPSSFASGDVNGNDGLGNGQPSIGGGYSNGYANSYSNPGFSYSYNTGLTTDTLATNNADVNPSTSSYSVAGSQTDVGALTGAGFWSGVAPVASSWDGGLAVNASNPLADGASSVNNGNIVINDSFFEFEQPDRLGSNKLDPYTGTYEAKPHALAGQAETVDAPLTPFSIANTPANSSEAFDFALVKQSLDKTDTKFSPITSLGGSYGLVAKVDILSVTGSVFDGPGLSAGFGLVVQRPNADGNGHWAFGVETHGGAGAGADDGVSVDYTHSNGDLADVSGGSTQYQGGAFGFRGAHSVSDTGDQGNSNSIGATVGTEDAGGVTIQHTQTNIYSTDGVFK